MQTMQVAPLGSQICYYYLDAYIQRMLVDLILSASIYLLNIFCPQNNFAQCRKIAVKIEFNNKKASLASLLRPHVSFMFDKRVSGWGQQETLVGSHIAVG